jgi:2-haloacid dehalogenase
MKQQNAVNSDSFFSSHEENSRRDFISKSAMGLMLVAAAGRLPFQWIGFQKNIKLILFDALAIFNPRPVFALTEKIFPGKGNEIAETWRTKQFEYTWLMEAAGQYRNFMEVTTDALLFAVSKAQLTITEADKHTLTNAYLSLELWPDILPTLNLLKEKNMRLGFLSNFTREMLNSNIQHNRLDGFFEKVLSTDQLKTYKPGPLAYKMGVDGSHLEKSEILFVAFAGWDAAGAKWFGYPVYWVNRLDAPAEELGVSVDMKGKTLEGIQSMLL